MLLLGGEPFAEEIVMWWNFIGRSHDEIVGVPRGRGKRRDPRLPAGGQPRREGDGGAADADRAAQAPTPRPPTASPEQGGR